MNLYHAFIFISAALVILSGVALAMLSNEIRKDVEKALEETADDPEAQAEVRKKVVRAMFPPRFPRD